MKILFISAGTSSYVPEAQQKIFLKNKWPRCHYADNFTEKMKFLGNEKQNNDTNASKYLARNTITCQ